MCNDLKSLGSKYLEAYRIELHRFVNLFTKIYIFKLQERK